MENYFTLEDKIIKKFNELYVTSRKKYLILNSEGRYTYAQTNKGYPPLNDGLIKDHLRGKKTIGVFGGEQLSKFLCFDIDFENELDKAKQVTYLIRDILIKIGFELSDIHISFSGKKGYHVLIFVENGTWANNLRLIFDTTKNKLNTYSILSVDEINHKVELRGATSGQGVKLELGKNFRSDKADNMCWFVDENLNPIKSMEYLLSINPMSKDRFNEIIDTLKDDETQVESIEDEKDFISENLTEPKSHQQNVNQDDTIDSIKDLLLNGLQMSGTRHNSVLKIAKYLRYMGISLDECIVELKEWMRKQDSKFYNTPMDECLSEVERVSTIVYEKGYTLTVELDEVEIFRSEMDQIMQIKDKNMKLVLYALLIHSKRYATKDGVFYMAYSSMTEAIGLKRKALISNINKLVGNGFIEVIDRNITQKGTFKKKPNKYKLNIECVSSNGKVYEINKSDTYEFSYYNTVINLFDDGELKNLPISKRQYYEFKDYRVNVS